MKDYCVYFLAAEETDFVKIGYCPNKGLEKQVRTMQTYHPGIVKAIEVIPNLSKLHSKRLIKALINKFGNIRRASQLIRIRPRFKGFLLNSDGIAHYKERNIREIEMLIEKWDSQFQEEITF